MAAASSASSGPSKSFATSASGEKEVLGQPRTSLSTAHLQPMCDGFDAAFPRSATHQRSTTRGLDALFLGSACQVPTARTADTCGPKTDTTRLQTHKRPREETEHEEALALPKPRRVKKDAQNIVGKQEPNAKRKRQALAERPNPPGATPVTKGPGGRPCINPKDALAASFPSFRNENGASVLGAGTTLSNGKAPDTGRPPSSSSVGPSLSDEEFRQLILGWSQSGLSPSPQDGTSPAVGPPVSEDISAPSAPSAPPACGASAAIEFLKSGDGALFGTAAFSVPAAGDPVDLGSAVPAPEGAPGVYDPFAEGPVAEGPDTESEPTQEDLECFINNLSMENFFETPMAQLQAQTSQQLAGQQPQQTEQLQEGVWASQPAEHGQQQQAPQNLSAQLPQQARDFQPLPLTGQQGQDQGQHMPLFPATLPPQQPAHGPPYAMPQWFDPFLTAPENALNAPFPPSRDGNGYHPTFHTWADENYPWNIYVYHWVPTYGQGFWRNVWKGHYRSAGPVPIPLPPQNPPQPPRGPRGGVLRGVGQTGVSASAPVNFGSAPVRALGTSGLNDGSGPLAAGSGAPAPAMMQEHPSEQILVDPALLATRDRPGEQVFRPMMSVALQGSPH